MVINSMCLRKLKETRLRNFAYFCLFSYKFYPFDSNTTHCNAIFLRTFDENNYGFNLQSGIWFGAQHSIWLDESSIRFSEDFDEANSLVYHRYRYILPTETAT
jgi:hypothetical protein